MPEPVAPASQPDADQVIRELQIEKLRLEVQSLASQRRKESLTQLLPVITACIAIGGLWLTANQFFVQQAKDRAERTQQQLLREESQVRLDLEQLLTLPRDEGRSAKVTQLLDDLVNLTETLPTESKRVTNVLRRFVMDDADFDNVRDIRIEAAAFDSWKPYGEYLKAETSDHEFIIYKYLQSLRHLHEGNPRYFETIEYDRDSGFRVRVFEKEPVYIKFLALTQGLVHHLGILPSDQRSTTIERYQMALNNRLLANQLFGTSSIQTLSRGQGAGTTAVLQQLLRPEEFPAKRDLYFWTPRQRAKKEESIPPLRQSR
jgi:hypothetical protein